MKNIKVSKATDQTLDWLVAKCEGVNNFHEFNLMWHCGHFHFSTDWSEGGPIIERERISLHLLDDKPNIWAADLGSPWKALPNVFSGLGPAPLIAAMRCYLASKLDDTAEVPEELF